MFGEVAHLCMDSIVRPRTHCTSNYVSDGPANFHKAYQLYALFRVGKGFLIKARTKSPFIFHRA